MPPKFTIKDMQGIAEARGGKCLYTEYVNSNTHLEWECSEGHHWETTPSQIKHKNSWCPKCAIDRGSAYLRGNIEEVRELATQKGGKCLSDKYINNTTHLLFECSEGPQWEATPKNIKKGRWCRKCYDMRRGANSANNKI